MGSTMQSKAFEEVLNGLVGSVDSPSEILGPDYTELKAFNTNMFIYTQK